MTPVTPPTPPTAPADAPRRATEPPRAVVIAAPAEVEATAPGPARPGTSSIRAATGLGPVRPVNVAAKYASLPRLVP